MFDDTMPTSLLRLGANNPGKNNPFSSGAKRRAKGIVMTLGVLSVAAIIAAIVALPRDGIVFQSSEDTTSAARTTTAKVYEPRYDLMLPRYQLPLAVEAGSA